MFACPVSPSNLFLTTYNIRKFGISADFYKINTLSASWDIFAEPKILPAES